MSKKILLLYLDGCNNCCNFIHNYIYATKKNSLAFLLSIYVTGISHRNTTCSRNYLAEKLLVWHLHVSNDRSLCKLCPLIWASAYNALV